MHIMRLSLSRIVVIALLVSASGFGCSAETEQTSEAVVACVDELKVSKCRSVSDANAAMCYPDNEVGPAPWSSDDAYPEYGCGAIVDRDGAGNEFGPPPSNWANWWCCAPSLCEPQKAIACECQEGETGRKFCRGDGKQYGACVCDSAKGP